MPVMTTDDLRQRYEECVWLLSEIRRVEAGVYCCCCFSIHPSKRCNQDLIPIEYQASAHNRAGLGWLTALATTARAPVVNGVEQLQQRRLDRLELRQCIPPGPLAQQLQQLLKREENLCGGVRPALQPFVHDPLPHVAKQLGEGYACPLHLQAQKESGV